MHFGRAAEELHTSQSTLSRRIRRLEEEMGVVLLTRTSRSVALTESGRELATQLRVGAGQPAQHAEGELVRAGGADLAGRLRAALAEPGVEDDEVVAVADPDEPAPRRGVHAGGDAGAQRELRADRGEHRGVAA